jgi:F-type H+-transporting ATPase subunit gamma
MSVASRYGHNVVAQFPKLDISYEVKEVIPVAKYVMDDFISGKYDKVMVAFTDFVSPSKQIPRVKQLLPVDVTAEKDHHLGVVGSDTRVGLDADFIKQKEDKYLRDKNSYVFEFEPSAAQVLSEMVPRLIEVQLFQALLESNASEHSARMAAMHQATDAAKDLAKQLNLFYNKARQAAITSEIAEISAGADALSG